MRRPENIRELVQLPIDLMGLIFYKKSPRHVPDSLASEIIAASGDSVARVGVFVNEAIEVVVQKVAKFKLQYVQLHGQEDADYCYDLLAKSARTFGCDDELQLIKAFSVNDAFDFSVTKDYTAYCKYFIFDTKGKNPGGNGLQFNWTLLHQYKASTPFLLSGGLRPIDAAGIQSLDFEQLAGVDLNSGFEIEPALKDVKSLEQFISIM